MAVLALADARTHLNIKGATHDAELAAVVASAEAVIAQHVGPLEPTTVTTTRTGYTSTLVLPVSPVISITSITDAAGTALTVADFALDGAAGLLTYASGAIFGSASYTVTYQSGRTTVPADLLLAVKELTRHLWESQRNPAPRPGFTDDSISSPAPGYLMPYRVQAVIAPHVQYYAVG